MRNRIATLGLVVALLGVPCAFGDTINYFTSGTYASSNPTTPLTAPGSSFSFSFSLSNPVSVSPCLIPPCSDDFWTMASVTYKSGSLSVTVPGTSVNFFLVGSAAPSSGGFDILFPLNGNVYWWQFFGASQLFNGSLSNPTLITGTFPYGTGVFVFCQNITGITACENSNAAISGGTLLSPQFGTIVASSPVTPIPEPGSLTLLGTGLVVVWGAMRRKGLTGIRKVKRG